MCTCNYTYVGPALLVLPLFVISLVNLFVAGPPLKTVVLDSNGASYGANLPFMQMNVQGAVARFNLIPKDEMTQFFVVACYAPGTTTPLYFDATVTGKAPVTGAKKELAMQSTRPEKPLVKDASETHVLQVLQSFVGMAEYEVLIRSVAPDRSKSSEAGRPPPMREAPLPAMEYRVTYVPTRFTYTQVCVRAFFTFTSCCMLVAYAAAMISMSKTREHGQLWMSMLLVLLVALNDPLYIARIVMGGNQMLYSVSVMGQILFSGGLFMFWLVYGDGMQARAERPFCSFYLPKLMLVLVYVGVSATLFLVHGRVPDRINVAEAHDIKDPRQLGLIAGLTGSLVGVGLWLSFLVSRAVYRLGWKKVEYIYTEREKSFVGITIVFVILWLCGHLYRAVHGRRGSWMQLQLPFLTLTNSYLALLTHAFWPSETRAVAPAEMKGTQATYDDKEGGLLADDDED